MRSFFVERETDFVGREALSPPSLMQQQISLTGRDHDMSSSSRKQFLVIVMTLFAWCCYRRSVRRLFILCRTAKPPVGEQHQASSMSIRQSRNRDHDVYGRLFPVYSSLLFSCRRRRRSGIQTLKRQLHNKSSFLIFAVSLFPNLNPYDCTSWTPTGGGRWSRSPVSPLVFPFGKQFKLTLRSSHLLISSSHSLPHLFTGSRWPILSLLSHSPISSFSSFKSVSVSSFLGASLRFPDEVLQA